MTPEMKVLSRRVIAHHQWRCVLGMKVFPIMADDSVQDVTGTVVGFYETMPLVYWPDLRETRAHHPREHLLPDLTDPATLGALLALVREVWGRPGICLYSIEVNGDLRWGWDGNVDASVTFATEAEALIVILEAVS